MVKLLRVGTSVVFLSGIGYRNSKGEVKYDVRAGSKGIIKKGKIKDSVALYDVELTIGTNLSGTKLIEDVEEDSLGIVQSDIIKPVKTFPTKVKKNRPWRKFTTEDLIRFAEANGVNWNRNENPKVNRMFLVKALDESPLKPPKTEKELNKVIADLS